MPLRTLLPIFDQLEGQRVLIRPYRLEDADALWEALVESRDHLRPWLPFADETEVECRDFLVHNVTRWLLREDFGASIWQREGGRFLGGIGAHPRDWNVPTFEIGYWLCASAEGYGYLMEAGRLFTSYFFDHLGAKRLEIRCAARNIRSANVARRLGFLQEARLRNNRVAPDGTLSDTLVFSMIPTDRK